MNNQPKTSLVIALSALCLMPVMALAQELQSADPGAAQVQTAPAAETGGPRHHHHHGQGGAQFQQFESTLTPEQKQQMSTIREQMKNDTAPLRQQIKSLQEQLSANPAPANADELKTKLDSLHEQLRSQFSAGRERMLSVLTDEQKAQLSQIRQQRHERWEQRKRESSQGADSDTK